MFRKKRRVVLCTPIARWPHNNNPYPEFLDSVYPSAELIEAAGWECMSTYEVGSAYISGARASMLYRALEAKADVVVFLDYDLSWRPADLLRLIETEGDVVAGTYRYKHPETDEYMGYFYPVPGSKAPIFRKDGCIKAQMVPGGFLKMTRKGIDEYAKAFPDLLYGDKEKPHLDLFSHGAHGGVWWGEDFAFCRRWLERCGDIWLIPDLEIDHHGFVADGGKDVPAVWKGNFLKWMQRQAAGAEPELPIKKRAGVPELASADDFPDLVAAA